MTKRIVAALVFVSVIAAPLRADFSDVARAISKMHGVKRTWIPFLGVARMAVWIASPKGVHDFEFATFEGGHDLDPAELRNLLRERAGKGFMPLVQVSSRRSNEWSFVYARPGKRENRMELLVLTRDGNDTTLVRVDIDGEVMARELGSPKRVASNVSQHSPHGRR